MLVIQSRYYDAVAAELMAGVAAELEAAGATFDVVEVPGALEIPQALGAATTAGLIGHNAQSPRYHGAIVAGCVIRGETSHYDIVCNNANHWLMQTAIGHDIPLGNAILTVDTEAQAMARARDDRDGKGGDAGRACLALIALKRSFARGGA